MFMDLPETLHNFADVFYTTVSTIVEMLTFMWVGVCSTVSSVSSTYLYAKV